MKKTYFAVLIASAVVAQAQGPHRGFGGPGGDMRIMGLEGGKPGTVVTGAPFSGKAVTTETQTLADGTHIQHTNTAQFYRDSQGRTRIERTFSGMRGNSTPATMVEIFDPVAGFIYTLNAANSTATKMAMPTPPNAAQIAKREAEHQTRQGSEQAVSTGLGTQSIQGLAATGTQSTRTIPAGTMGNDRAITITSQRWVSTDLQLTVQSKRTGPEGETNFEFQNISRTEPDASLFQVPSTYTVTTKTAMRHGPTPAE